jgi:N-methylhydantoinase A
MQAETLLQCMGVAGAHVTLQRLADARYVGQGHQIVVPLPEGTLGPQHQATIEASFEQVYRQLFGRALNGVPIEGITWRLTALGQGAQIDFTSAHAHSETALESERGHRAMYLPEVGAFVEVPVYNRYGLHPGTYFDGPAVIEERESTVVIGRRGRCTVDTHGNLSIALSKYTAP